MYPNYNPSYPYGMQNLYGVPNYPQNTQQMPQQAQTIQKVNPQTEEQVICYSVKNANEIANIKAVPFTSYIGINDDAHEIYVRKMKNDGTVGTDTYVLAAEKQEKTEAQIISERLNSIEQKLNALIMPEILKGKDNGSEPVS